MSPAKKLQTLQKEDFDRLLDWLDPDGAHAGLIYEKIRWRLIAILAARGCRTPEDLADEIIDRVARRVKDIEATYVGDKAIYFLGVMNNVHHEYLKRQVAFRSGHITRDDTDAKERMSVCLEKCLTSLSSSSRALIEQYYSADKKSENRSTQADRPAVWCDGKCSASPCVAHQTETANLHRTMFGGVGSPTVRLGLTRK